MLQLLWTGVMICTFAPWLTRDSGDPLMVCGIVVMVGAVLGAVIKRLELIRRPPVGSLTPWWGGLPNGPNPVTGKVTVHGHNQDGDPVIETVELKGTEPQTLKGPWR